MGELTAILAALGVLFPGIQRDKDRRNAQSDAALTAVMEALSETQVYLNAYGRTRRRSRKTEGRLVTLWKNAAVPLRHLDRDLASRCMHKGEYWLNPESYSENDIQRLGIGIKRVQEEAEKLHLKN